MSSDGEILFVDSPKCYPVLFGTGLQVFRQVIGTFVASTSAAGPSMREDRSSPVAPAIALASIINLGKYEFLAKNISFHLVFVV